MVIGAGHLGDFAVGATVNLKFSTLDAVPRPASLSGGALAVYKANGTTETTAGVGLTADFDSRAGLNHAHIDTADAFYAAGNDYQVVLTAGTVDSVDQNGFVVGSFSIVNRPVQGLADGVFTAASIAAAACNKLADHVLRRNWASAAASSDGDAKGFRSLLGAVAKLVNRVRVVGTTLTVYESDDTTPLGTQTATPDSGADPITEVDTD